MFSNEEIYNYISPRIKDKDLKELYDYYWKKYNEPQAPVWSVDGEVKFESWPWEIYDDYETEALEKVHNKLYDDYARSVLGKQYYTIQKLTIDDEALALENQLNNYGKLTEKELFNEIRKELTNPLRHWRADSLYKDFFYYDKDTKSLVQEYMKFCLAHKLNYHEEDSATQFLKPYRVTYKLNLVKEDFK